MKPGIQILHLPYLLAFGCCSFILSSCLSLGDDYKVRSEVHDDGSVERTISYYTQDTILRESNSFGASARNGWTATNEAPSDTSMHGRNFRFTKRYISVDSATSESVSAGHPFRIKSELETQFRWFYTTVRYTDTYLPIIHFETVSLDDYFDEEDFKYLNERMQDRAKPDSLRELEFKKKYDHYLSRGYFEALMVKIETLMRSNSVESKWIDTLRAHKESFYTFALGVNSVEEMGPYLTDSLHLPLKNIIKRGGEIEPKDFYKDVPIFDRIEHTIVMPQDITESNSTTKNGKMASWILVVEYSLKPFSMSAESRKINYWAILVIIGPFVGAFVLFLRRKSSKQNQ